MDLLSIISTVLAFLTGGGLVAILTVRQQKRQKEGEATQSVERGKQEQLTTVEIQDRIYERLNSRLDVELERRDKKIDELEVDAKERDSIIKDMAVTIELQDGNLKHQDKKIKEQDLKIKHLENTVKEYKETCDTCQFRLEKKAKLNKS